MRVARDTHSAPGHGEPFDGARAISINISMAVLQTPLPSHSKHKSHSLVHSQSKDIDQNNFSVFVVRKR